LTLRSTLRDERIQHRSKGDSKFLEWMHGWTPLAERTNYTQFQRSKGFPPGKERIFGEKLSFCYRYVETSIDRGLCVEVFSLSV
jgi:hypothetical protein